MGIRYVDLIKNPPKKTPNELAYSLGKPTSLW